MNLSTVGEHLIKGFEKLRLQAYEDSGGTPTIGWGHTANVKRGMTITEETAEEFFWDDVEPIEQTLSAFVLSQSMFDALASLCFNVGSRAVHGRATIGRALMARDYIGAWRGFSLWVATPGQELGLARRRSVEMEMFLRDPFPTG